jgi:hypothetical protein
MKRAISISEDSPFLSQNLVAQNAEYFAAKKSHPHEIAGRPRHK